MIVLVKYKSQENLMKILILANNGGGLFHFRRELLEALVKEHKVYVSVPDGEYIQEIKALGCKVGINRVLNRRGKNPFQDLRLLSYYDQIIKGICPDIVFTYTIKPNVYGGLACRRQKVPYVANITGLGTAVENGGLLQWITLFLYKEGLKGAQKVFFQNEENRDFMLAKGIIGEVEYDLIPGSGVNLDRYQYSEYPDTGTTNFIFVARVMKEKGIDQFLEAAELIKKKYPYTRFHVCGDCEQDYEELLADYEKRNLIVYHGVVKDMTEIYRMAACTVHPTYYPEGMSNVLLESCASGRPIITTNRPGCREIVDDGENGFVVEERNSRDLAEKLEYFLQLGTDMRREMGKAARRKAERHFDRKLVVEKYLAEVNKVKEKGKLCSRDYMKN